jgi:hypothetical protein
MLVLFGVREKGVGAPCTVAGLSSDLEIARLFLRKDNSTLVFEALQAPVSFW